MQTESTLRCLIRSDIDAWARVLLQGDAGSARSPVGAALRLLWLYPGFRAVLLYRVSHALQRRGVRALPLLLYQTNLTAHGFDVPPSVPIGPGLYVPHPVGTVVMAHRIGANVTLVSGVTIGMRNEPRFPTIGDDVYIGAGARVLGDISVGNGVGIGANAVVMRDVPDHSVAVGVPATVRPRRAHDTALPAADTPGVAVVVGQATSANGHGGH